jgi:hypothetical protein
MAEINWNAFKVKFNGKERLAFEQLAYQLFCFEFKRPMGLFRFKNQSGIETEPIATEHGLVGFQAKFLDISVARGKSQIIESIQNAKKNNGELSRLLLYINQEIAESPKQGKKDPRYKTEIENEAASLDITLEWRVPSHMEIQLATPQNSHLLQHFFEIGKGAMEFLEEIKQHTDNLLRPIHSEIRFGNNTIKISHTREVELLQNPNKHTPIILVYGEGGSGKTGVIKDLYTQLDPSVPFYLFKAAEFNIQNVNSFTKPFGQFTFHDFIKFHEDQKTKYFVIDSAERLSDFPALDVFRELLSALMQANWKIIFTTRLTYLDDLRFQIVEVFRSNFTEVNIPNLATTDLQNLAQQNKFNLPSNSRLLNLILIPFYLNEYLRHHKRVDDTDGLVGFKNMLWKTKVAQSSHQDNINIRREETFMRLAKKKCDLGNFFLNPDPSDDLILSKLGEDEIIKYDEVGGYFIAHDIYEEWALERIIEREFRNASDHKTFLNKIGKSLPMRRSFRSWLSSRLAENPSSLKSLIDFAAFQNDLESFWKDEIFISVLLSDQAQHFFVLFKANLLASDKTLLKRIIFLLRTAGKEVDTFYYQFAPKKTDSEYLVTKPKAMGWTQTIAFIYSNRNEFSHNEQEYFVPFLAEWVRTNPKGAATRNASLMILEAYKDAEVKRKARFYDPIQEEMESIILQGAIEIKDELAAIFDQVIQENWGWGNNPFFSLCEAVLTRTDEIISLAKVLPQSIISIARLMWSKEGEVKPKSQFGFDFPDDSVESDYYLREHSHREYFPASALQSPILWLLRFNPELTIEFILDFVNKAVAHYANSPSAKRLDNVKTIDIFFGDGTSQKQFIAHSLWQTFRGTGSPVVPYLIQTIHMALEKYLLEMAKSDPDKTRIQLVHLLKNSQSASITAIVTSVVLAHAKEMFAIALTLFRTSELFHYDNMRMSNEFQVRSLNSIGYGMNKSHKMYEDERIATCDQPHRKNCLEWQIILYQKFRSKEMTEDEQQNRQSSIWNILDQHYSSLPPEINQRGADLTKRLLLARIDGRKLSARVEEKGDSLLIFFDSEVEPRLQEHSEEATKASLRFMKYTPLQLWANNKLELSTKASEYPQYDGDPGRALKDIKELIEDLNDKSTQKFPNEYTIPTFACAALVKFYSETLKSDDLKLCRDVLMQFATSPLKENYEYQIADGVEAAVSTLPALLKLYPTDRIDIMSIMLAIMFDRHEIGEYKRVCDYAIESAVNGFSSESPDDLKGLFLGYLTLAQRFDEHIKNSGVKGYRFHNRNARISALSSFIKDNQKQFEAVALNKLCYQSPDQISVVHGLTAFKFIPPDTIDEDYVRFVKWLLPQICLEIANDKDHENFKLKYKFFRMYANFVLKRKSKEDIEPFVKPWIGKLNNSTSFHYFIQEFVSAEDEIFSYDQFWMVWNLLYPYVRDYCNSRQSYRIDEVVSTYLLAWPYWRSGIKEWRSLKSSERSFFRIVAKEMGSHPATLYSLSKLVNDIGHIFFDEGLTWISEMLNSNPKLSTAELHRNTIYYLETYARTYTHLNRITIKSDISVKNNLLTILNFLIDKGSVQAYMVREEIV